MVSQPSSFAKAPPGVSADVVAVGEDNRGIGMDFAVLQPRHPVVHAAGYFADFRMQRTAEGDVHFLQAAADAEQRHAAGDASFRQRQRHVVAMHVIGLMLGVRFGLETGRMHIGARAGQHDAVDGIQERTDVGNFRRAGKHQRQRARDLGHRAKIPFTDHLCREAIFDAMGVSDHADYGPSHRSTFRYLRQIIYAGPDFSPIMPPGRRRINIL